MYKASNSIHFAQPQDLHRKQYSKEAKVTLLSRPSLILLIHLCVDSDAPEARSVFSVTESMRPWLLPVAIEGSEAGSRHWLERCIEV